MAMTAILAVQCWERKTVDGRMTPINVSNIDMKILLAQTGKLRGTSLTGVYSTVTGLRTRVPCFEVKSDNFNCSFQFILCIVG